jgi:signal transduction histidine kinase
VRDEAIKGTRILIVDDEAANVRLLERLLERAGYTNVRSTTDPRQVLPLYNEFRPDLVLLDLLMPHLDGFQIMEKLNPLIPEGAYLPILVLTADVSAETKRRALSAGAKDFVTKPFDAIEALLRIGNLLETRFLHLALQQQNELLEGQVRERTQRLLQTEKVATMGELLAGVAHELNNPLSVIAGQTALLRETVGAGPLGTRAEKIAKAAERCARIVKNFLALARQHPPERQHVRLNQVIEEAVELLAYPLRVDNVEVKRELAEDLPVLWADPHQLHQVVVNLVSNAHHAMRGNPPPRRLTLATRSDLLQGRVSLEVADTGPGIPPAIQARIFEPFFTTKPPGQGTGLGLSLCQGIVEAHGGTMRVESPSGQGAVFRIELPVMAPPVAVPEARTAEGLPPLRDKAILVVDDEPEIAEVLADLLSLDGHQVETAGSGAIALDKLRERAYDVILSDIRMPGLDGPGLYRELARNHAGLVRRFIFITGDILSPETREFLEQNGTPSLSKPFVSDDVRRIVQQVLRNTPPIKRALLEKRLDAS